MASTAASRTLGAYALATPAPHAHNNSIEVKAPSPAPWTFGGHRRTLADAGGCRHVRCEYAARRRIAPLSLARARAAPRLTVLRDQRLRFALVYVPRTRPARNRERRPRAKRYQARQLGVTPCRPKPATFASPATRSCGSPDERLTHLLRAFLGRASISNRPAGRHAGDARVRRGG